ncbi:MAG: hypothetical protein IT371_17775 [Deltaproteobacteria bacterium]|nr:hypothetical protein [Deltaproteobacteria bacterium]
MGSEATVRVRGSGRNGATPSRPFLRGMALGHYTDLPRVELAAKLRELKALGASHVSIVAQWSTRDVRSTSIAPRPDHTTPDAVLERMIAHARTQGLSVLLFPILDVQRRKPLEWRGTLKPTDWDAWWRSYRRFILHYARLAARTRAAILCVGSELVTTEGMRERWVELIAEVRKVYRGALLYSANWDHFEPVSFWEHVDLVGVTAYHSLAQKNDAPEEEMYLSWLRVRDTLGRWSRRLARPFIFTEVGYPSQDGGAVHPWDYTQGTAADPEEQRRAYRAFVRAWHGDKTLAGVFFWDWYGSGGLMDTQYTPRHKPAESVIRHWFRSRR